MLFLRLWRLKVADTLKLNTQNGLQKKEYDNVYNSEKVWWGASNLPAKSEERYGTRRERKDYTAARLEFFSRRYDQGRTQDLLKGGRAEIVIYGGQ